MNLTCDGVGLNRCPNTVELEADPDAATRYRSDNPSGTGDFLKLVESEGWCFGWGFFFCPKCTREICESAESATAKILAKRT